MKTYIINPDTRKLETNNAALAAYKDDILDNALFIIKGDMAKNLYESCPIIRFVYVIDPKNNSQFEIQNADYIEYDAASKTLQFRWVLRRNFTQYSGKDIAFEVLFANNSWGSRWHTSLRIEKILSGIEYSTTAQEDAKLTDLYTDLYNQLEELADRKIAELDSHADIWNTKADKTELNEVKEDIRALGGHFIAGNLFDKDNVIINHFYAGDKQTPTLSNENNQYACYLAELPHDDTKYICNYKASQFDIYDADKQRIRQAYVTAGQPFTVPQNAKYLTVSVLKSNVKDMILVEGETLPSEYIPFGTMIKNGSYKAKPKEYHVGAAWNSSEYFEYDNLTALLRKLKDDDSEKIIYVHGSLNIFNEYGGESYMATLTGTEKWSDVSVFVPNNTKIIGVGNAILRFEPSASDIKSEAIAHLFSALNVSENVWIENITIEAKNCRYCIHDEINEKSTGTTHVYKNVRLHKTQDTYGDVQAFGCGFGDSMRYEFENCEFTSWSIPFSMHNTDTTEPRFRTVINIRNCYFQSQISSVSVSFRNSSSKQVEHIANIYDSFVGGQWENLEITDSGNHTAVNCFNVTMVNCNHIRTKDDMHTTNIYPIKQINSIYDFDAKSVVTDNANGLTKIPLEYINGYYLSGDGATYNPNGGFKYTKPFYVDKPCTIKVKAQGTGTVVNILSKCNKDGGYYREIIRCTDNTYKWYSAKVTEIGYYTICTNKDTDAVCYIADEENLGRENMLAMFSRIVCCGDSLTWGAVYTGGSGQFRQAKVPYNEAIQKITGVTTERYATAGYTTKQWWDNNNTHLNEEALYIIFLGTNGGLTDTVTTDCNGDNIEDFADTNTGCYGKILQVLKNNNKTAVLIKPPVANAETHTAIDRLAKKYNFPTIQLPPELENNYYHFAPHNTNSKNDIHYNDHGYVLVANAIINAVNNFSPSDLFKIAPY